MAMTKDDKPSQLWASYVRPIISEVGTILPSRGLKYALALSASLAACLLPKPRMRLPFSSRSTSRRFVPAGVWYQQSVCFQNQADP